ncbi:MAG: nitronate monooxygenase [Sulfitobacter sp.]
MHSFFEDIGATIPLIQAPMAGAQDEKLAIAIAQKGGIGSIACARLELNEISTSARQFRDQSSGPLNLNFFCHAVAPRDAQREAVWQKELSRYYTENALGFDYPTDVALYAIDAETVDIICAIKPEVVSFHFGMPPKDFVDRIRATGSKIIASATTLKEALYLEEQGCDAVIAQGCEAGGHQGVFLPTENTTPLPMIELVTRCVVALNIPIIAAGGIADDKTIRAAMQAGAIGVQIGTRFLKTPESTIPSRHRALLDGQGVQETAITNVFTGRPARGFVTKLVQELGPMNPNVQTFPLAISAITHLKTATKGSDDFVAMWAGQNWEIGQEKPAADVVDELATGLDNS